MTNNIQSVSARFPANTGYFLGYDEMRHMHTCQLCAQRYPTAGQLLAWHFGQSVATIRGLSSNSQSRIYAWNDMFDPNHNAHDNYYLVEGDISGSWSGLGQ